MDKVRIGIIGLGNIGQVHVGNLMDGKVPRGELTAVGDAIVDKLPDYEAKGLKTFDLFYRIYFISRSLKNKSRYLTKISTEWQISRVSPW